MTIYLTPVEVLLMHRVLISRYGGAQGLRDPGALEAALYRSQSGYYDDVIQQAAALWESVTKNHPFIDGNKRTGFAVTDSFLRLNGRRITAKSDTIWKFITILLEKNEFEYIKLEPWLRKNTEIIAV